MELTETVENHPEKGEDNRAFESEDDEQGIFTHKDRTSEGRGERPYEQTQLKKSFLEKKIEVFQGCLRNYKYQINKIFHLVLTTGFVATVIAACVLNFNRATELLVISLVTLFFLVWDWAMERYGNSVWVELYPIRKCLQKNWFWIKRIMYVSLIISVVCWLILDTAKRGTRQLISFCGLLVLVFFMLLFSKHPFKWSVQTLLSGVGLQFVFGLLVLRSSFGVDALVWLGKKVKILVSYADVGSKFVFGATYTDHYFAFKAMPMLVFLSTLISILFYTGLVHWLSQKIGFAMRLTMGTSATESLVATGNIFLGQTESLLLIRPYISRLTCSEIHAVLAGGLASVSGPALGAFISFGVEPSHLLTATLMSAPASLAVAKAFWPETETPSVTTDENLEVNKGNTTSILEAASIGASNAVEIVANIIAHLISFLAMQAFVDALLSWFGAMLDCPELGISLICSYVFMPLSFMMGVSWEDSFIVGELIGIKTFINEFLAFQKMSKLIKLRKAGGPEYVHNVKQYLSVHSEAIATYALCGFSSIASVGMSIGVMSSIAPQRRADISSCGFRALITSSVSCFMTACIAGMLYIPDVQCPHFLSSAFSNSSVTISTQLVTCCTQLFNSVTVFEPWNVTIGDGFSQSSLQGCCTLTIPTHFNCTLA